MTRLRILAVRVLALFGRRRLDATLDDEVGAHLQLLTAEHVRRGLSQAEARAAARRDFGGIEQVKEVHRYQRGLPWIDDIYRDVRYALRMLAKTPGFTAVTVLTLALGIGANTAVFSVANSLLLRALPVAEPDRLVVVSSARTINGGFTAGWEYAIWDQIQQRAEAFDGAFAASGFRHRLDLAQGGHKQPVDSVFVSGDFFSTLGVPALLGRPFSGADDVRGGGPDGPLAVISYGFWQRQLGGAADVVGRTLVVDRIPVTVVGVTPPEFFGAEVGRSFDVALPLSVAPTIFSDEAWLDSGPTFLTIMLRLKPGQSLESATATLRAFQPQILVAAFGPDVQSDSRMKAYQNDPFVLLPAAAGVSMLRLRYEQPLVTILAIVGLVLVVACANIAHLMLARAATRKHELSVRLALGSSRGRLMRQLFVESLVLSGGGALAGLVFAVWGSRALVANLSMFGDPVSLDLPLDWRVLAFTAAMTVLTAVLFGTAPALRATRMTPIEVLKAEGAGVRLGGRAPRGLLVGQVALAMVLLVTAGLFVQTFQRLASVALGFDSDRLLVVKVDATRAAIDPADRIGFYDRLVDAVAVVPGVARAAGSVTTPIDFGPVMVTPVEVPGSRSVPEPQRTLVTYFVTPGWFGTYGTTIRTGRDISDVDTASSLPVVVVNEAFARRFFPAESPIGKAVVATWAPPGRTPRSRTIVGVVDNAVAMSLRDEAPATMYVPLTQHYWGRPLTEIQISVRSSAESSAALAPSVAAALSTADRDLAFSFRPLADQVNASLAQERLVAMLSGFFGLLALLITAVGLYGVTSYMVSQRRSEIGIRMALGAPRAAVIGLVLRTFMSALVGGVIIGLAGAATITQVFEGLLFGVTGLDPTTFTVAALLLAGVATIAVFLPMRRATKIEPLTALRYE